MDCVRRGKALGGRDPAEGSPLDLQQEARGGKGFVDCESTIQLEREAYQAQRDFLLRYGVYQPVVVSLHHVGCELTAQAPPD